MRAGDGRFLLLTGKLGDPERDPLTDAQLRLLAHRIPLMKIDDQDADLTMKHLSSIGLDAELSEKILRLLGDELQLHAYWNNAKNMTAILFFGIRKHTHRSFESAWPGMLPGVSGQRVTGIS